MKVKWDNGLPVTVKSSMNEMSMTETYTRDEKGNIIKITTLYEDVCDGSTETQTITLEYGEDAFDSEGNWVKRTVTYPDGHQEIQERKITYYE